MSEMEALPPQSGDLCAIDAVPVTVADLAAGASSAAAIRRAALERWAATHDPEHRIERSHLFDAAALAHLIETEDGPAFDDAQFGALVAFVAELPW